MASSHKIGRSAITGRYAPVKVAQTRPTTYVVETVKTPPKPTTPKK